MFSVFDTIIKMCTHYFTSGLFYTSDNFSQHDQPTGKEKKKTKKKKKEKENVIFLCNEHEGFYIS